jgi:hypothetical protein
VIANDFALANHCKQKCKKDAYALLKYRNPTLLGKDFFSKTINAAGL